jgi:Fic family protein
VQTLIDGITVGGHKISDVQQVLNIKDAWNLMLEALKSGTFSVTKSMFHAINDVIVRNDAMERGKFRTGPIYTELENVFDQELPLILGSKHEVEQAICLFLWAALNQFYWDGNKRTARLMANGILISAGYGVLNISTRDILEFNTLLIEFYETRQADAIVRFLAEKCIWYIE